jgi:hypothetical protein
MTGSEFNQALQRSLNAALARHSRELEEAEDEEDRNTARELTIKDYRKDQGFGRYIVRAGSEMIYGGTDLEDAIEAIAMHFLEMET